MNLKWIFLLANLINCSAGDESTIFQKCKRKCIKVCDKQPQLSLILRLTLWNCDSECSYKCMHQITESSRNVLQYYGKWPFWRLYGMQEPASVLFSIGNGFSHYYGAKKYFYRIGSRYKLRSILLIYAIASINTWFWSALFHSRDLPFTEKMDYFSAILGLLIALYYCLHRVFNIRLFSMPSSGLLIVFALFFFCHISYLSFYKFDYGYNTIACVAVGLSHNIIWFIWSILNRKKRKYAWKIGVSVFLFTAAGLFEVFDFPPVLFVIDAHSLWHLSTIPIIRMYWDFFYEDAISEISKRIN